MSTSANRDLASLRVSPFNGRTTRPPEDIQRLSERIQRNGFETTRAPWITADGEVFAGWTRVLAAREAGLTSIPVVVHEGLSAEEIVALADADNENDEYHVRVPLLDVWAAYAALAELGWTQERIAKAKGCSVPTVSNRIALHRELPASARKATLDGLFDEGHGQAVIGVALDVQSLAPWLTTSQARDELVAEVLKKHRGSTAGIKPTVAVVREGAKRWKEMLAAAAAGFERLPETFRRDFVERLGAKKVRSLAGVEAEIAASLHHVALAAEQARQAADGVAAVAAMEAARATREQSIVSKIALGDARELLPAAPHGARLVLTDPPYGVAYQSASRRKVSAPKKAIANDEDVSVATALLTEVLRLAFAAAADDAHALVFTGWRYEPEFRVAIEAAGWRVQQSLVWVKNNHGIGNTETTFAPKHERIIYAAKGRPTLLKRHPDVLFGKDEQDSWHPTEKPRDLLHHLIEATTSEGDLVLDPFAGSGNILRFPPGVVLWTSEGYRDLFVSCACRTCRDARRAAA